MSTVKLLTLEQVLEKTTLSRSTIYAHMDEGIFPRPVKFGPHHVSRVRWIEKEVDEWIQAAIDRRDAL